MHGTCWNPSHVRRCDGFLYRPDGQSNSFFFRLEVRRYGSVEEGLAVRGVEVPEVLWV